MTQNSNSGFAYGETARRRRGIAYQLLRQGGHCARPDARSRGTDGLDEPREFWATDLAQAALGTRRVTRTDEFGSLAAALLARRRKDEVVLLFDEAGTSVGDGLEKWRAACEEFRPVGVGKTGRALTHAKTSETEGWSP